MKAVFSKDYLSFDDNFPYEVQIINENNTIESSKVFATEIEALIFIQNFNSKK